jgi:hypothetical protein
MATIVTRSGKGSPLSIAEGDANFTNLNNDKIELDDISVTTASVAETAALSYNNTTGVLTFTPTATGDLIAEIVEDTTPQLGGNLDVQSNSIVTSVTNGSITIDPNGTGTIILNGTTSCQGNIDLHSNRIETSVTNENITLSANGNGKIVMNNAAEIAGALQIGGNLDVQSHTIQSSTDNDLNLQAVGTGSIVLTGTTVELPQPILEWTGGVGKIKAATSIDLNTDTILLGYDSSTTNVVVTGAVSSNSDITIRPSGTGEIVLDDNTSINGDFDIKNNNITTSTTNGSIAIQNNGTGVTTVNGGLGFSIATGYLNTGTDTDLILNPNGTGAVVVNATTSGFVVADTGSSGYGSITGTSSTGIGISANAGAQAATDSKILVTSGGGLTLQAGSGSTATITGNDVSITANNLVDFNGSILSDYGIKNYQVETYVPGGGSGVSGTYAPDWANGSYHYLVMVGNVTINDFGGTIEAGQVIQIVKDDTVVGGNTLTFGSKFLTPGGTISQTSSGMDLYEIVCLDATSGSEVYIIRAYNNIQ